MPYNEEQTVSAIKAILKTVAALRAPNGCPWDREQTHATLRQFLIEEAYETIEVLDQIKAPSDFNQKNLKTAFIEEWGDVLLQILLNAEIASETHPDISFESIAASLNEKMIRRHPHVFGSVEAKTADKVIQNWEQIKKEEKKTAGVTQASVLDGISKGLPPLPRTMKVISKVTKVGFQWPDLKGPTEKLDEEIAELKAALSHTDLPKEEYLQKIESEMGDVLFSVCNIAYFLKLDPETAIRNTLRKFESRFRYVETGLAKQGKKPEEVPLSEMDALWDEAKRIERS